MARNPSTRDGTLACMQEWQTYSSGSQFCGPPGSFASAGLAQPRFDLGRVTQNQRRKQIRRRDVREQRQQPFGTARRVTRRATDEFVDSLPERQRSCLHFFAQRGPGRESMLASDHRLRVVQRQVGCVYLVHGFAGKRWQGGEAVERLSITGLRRM